jgi:hypothetical protein
MGQGGVRVGARGVVNDHGFRYAQIRGIAMDAHLLELILIFFILTK